MRLQQAWDGGELSAAEAASRGCTRGEAARDGTPPHAAEEDKDEEEYDDDDDADEEEEEKEVEAEEDEDLSRLVPLPSTFYRAPLDELYGRTN